MNIIPFWPENRPWLLFLPRSLRLLWMPCRVVSSASSPAPLVVGVLVPESLPPVTFERSSVERVCMVDGSFLASGKSRVHATRYVLVIRGSATAKVVYYRRHHASTRRPRRHPRRPVTRGSQRR